MGEREDIAEGEKAAIWEFINSLSAQTVGDAEETCNLCA
jgi:hypothetical protein